MTVTHAMTKPHAKTLAVDGPSFTVSPGAVTVRHSAGAIRAFVACSFRSPVLHIPGGHPGRFMPELIAGNSIAAAPINGTSSSMVGRVLTTLYAAVALVSRGALLARRDA